MSHRQLIETSRPPSSLQKVGIEHKNSHAFPHCTAADSQKIFLYAQSTTSTNL